MLRWLYRISPNVVTWTPPIAIQPLAAWVSECIAFILMIRVFSREWFLVYGSVLGSLGTHVSSFRSINNYHVHLASNRSIWQNLHSYFKLGLHKLCCHRVTVARTANLWKRARPQSLHRPNPMPFSGWYLLQTSASTNCRVGNRLQDISKTRRDGWKMLEERCRPNDRPLRGHQKVNFVCSAVWNEIERWRQTRERACLWTNMSGKPAITLVAIDTANKPWFWK